METLQYIGFLIGQFSPIIVPFLVFAPLSVWLAYRAHKRRTLDPRCLVASALLLVFPFLLILLGGLWEHTSWESRSGPPLAHWQLGTLHGIMILGAAAIVVTIVRCRGCRAAVASWSIPVALLLLLSWFVGGMSITGDWM